MTKAAPSATQDRAPAAGGGRSWLIRSVVAVAVLGLAALLFFLVGDQLTLESLADRESQLRRLQGDHPLLVLGIAFLVYVVVTGLSLPGATVLTLLYGWYFGWVPAVILVSFASTTGATLAFLISRFLFRSALEHRFGQRLERFNRSLEQEGPFFLFSLRLIPAVPFFIINVVMGLTPIRVGTYWWVSQLGMFPATMVYVYAGSAVPDLNRLAEQGVNAVFSPVQLLQLFLAFALLGLLPLAARWLVKRFRESVTPRGKRPGT